MIYFKGFFLLRNTGFTLSSQTQYKQAIQPRFSFSHWENVKSDKLSLTYMTRMYNLNTRNPEKAAGNIKLSLFPWAAILVSKL